LGDDLIATTAAADLKLAALQLRIDRYIQATGIEAPAADPFVPTWPLGLAWREHLDLRAERVRTVIWATGYRRSYRWLRVPVLDADGEIQHQGGVTPCPGLFVLGLNFQRRRNSSFIDGVGADAEYLVQHIADHVGQQLIA
jgi:putative flavoprotein involved in K+ transport